MKTLFYSLRLRTTRRMHLLLTLPFVPKQTKLFVGQVIQKPQIDHPFRQSSQLYVSTMYVAHVMIGSIIMQQIFTSKLLINFFFTVNFTIGVCNGSQVETEGVYKRRSLSWSPKTILKVLFRSLRTYAKFADIEKVSIFAQMSFYIVGIVVHNVGKKSFWKIVGVCYTDRNVNCRSCRCLFGRK